MYLYKYIYRDSCPETYRPTMIPPIIPNTIAKFCRVSAVLACRRAAAVSPLAKAFDTSEDSHMAQHPRGQQQKRNTNTDLARKNIGAHLRDNEQPGHRCALS